MFKEYLYDTNGKIIGVKAFDKISGKEIEIKADVVVNCTGVFADNNLPKEDKSYGKLIVPAKGKLYKSLTLIFKTRFSSRY